MTAPKEETTDEMVSATPVATGAGTIDARRYAACEVTRNGLKVQIRSVCPDDGDRVDRAFSGLSQESIQSRFFAAKSGLTDADHRMIRELDFDTRVMLLVTIVEGVEEIVIASGSYHRVGRDAAEVAFVVEEDYHGLGIARRLLWHLARIARDRGIVRFEAEVLPHNAPMLRVFAASGWPMTQRREDGVAHITLALDVDQVFASGTSGGPRLMSTQETQPH